MGKKIILFADGTGNAFTTQESNVWRIYQALDLSKPDQIGFYVKGVGTSGFGLWAKLDGATGIGVPANVRMLYRFLCWNWQEGDEIYAFGFSRGSFTIRTLIGMIEHEGLLPTEMPLAPDSGNRDDRISFPATKKRPVTQREMLANSKAAWRHYRAETASDKVLWTVRGARAIRDGMLRIVGLFRKNQPSYATVRTEVDNQKRKKIPIKFLGLFDTVEAYGLPIEELRGVVDWAIWPITFREHKLYKEVEHARHALALDDERTTFHPIRFDQTGETSKNRIKEVWFAGMHSDVGGGYPDNSLAYVPLVWMAEEAELVTTVNGQPEVMGLRFLPGSIDAYRQYASPFGACHNSRSGAAMFYRYSPRTIGTGSANGGAPVIHHSVAAKMMFGSEHYAPVVLPDETHVLMPDGKVATIKGFSAAARARASAKDYETVADLDEPDTYYIELTRDTIWWRRIAYFTMMAGLVAVVAMPYAAARLRDIWHDSGQTVAGWFGQKKWWDDTWESWHNAEQGISAMLQSVARVLGNLVPGYLKPWFDVIVEAPLATGLIIAVFVSAVLWHGRLKDKINDRAHLAWFASARDRRKAEIEAAPVKKGRKASDKNEGGDNADKLVRNSKWLRLARCLRQSKSATGVYGVWAEKIVPGLFLAAIFLTALVTVSRNTVTYRGEQLHTSFGFCTPTPPPTKEELGTPNEEKRLMAPADGKVVVRDGDRSFKTDSLCWASGVKLEKGRKYTLWIDVVEPFFDRTLVADIAGFKGTWAQTIVLPIRRWWTAEWFQPIARVTSTTENKEWPLVAVDGLTPREYWKGKDGKAIESPNVKADVSGMCNPLPKDKRPTLDQARKELGDDKINRRFISEFVAPVDGELFVYVNDAIFALPFLDTSSCWYDNNSGSARISIRKEPLP